MGELCLNKDAAFFFLRPMIKYLKRKKKKVMILPSKSI